MASIQQADIYFKGLYIAILKFGRKEGREGERKVFINNKTGIMVIYD